MTMNRREFLILGAGLLAGCAVTEAGAGRVCAAAGERTIDAGAADAFREEGVYDNYLYQGFFLIRKAGQLLAVSSLCTHRRCNLKVAPDQSFFCPCHGSAFSPEGVVRKGPAQRNLPLFPVRIDDHGRVLVQVFEI